MPAIEKAKPSLRSMGRLSRARLWSRRCLALLFYLWLLSLALAYFNRNLGYAIDDSYISFRYALNLAQGHGLVFNPGEYVYGSTAMGFAGLLGAVAWLLSTTAQALGITRISGMDLTPETLIPTLAIAVSAMSLALMALLFDRIGQRFGRPLSNRLILVPLAFYLFASFPSNFVAGHETYPFVASLFLGSYLVVFERKAILGGTSLFVATMLRPDAMLLVLLLFIVLGVPDLFTSRAAPTRAFLIRLGAAYALPMLLWTGFLWSYFGTPVPVTMEAKQAQVLLGHWPVFTVSRGLAELRLRLPAAVVPVVAVGAICAGLIAFVRRRDRAAAPEPGKGPLLKYVLLWALFPTLLLLFYDFFVVTFWWWYVYPVFFAVLLLFLVAVHSVIDAVGLVRAPALRSAVLAVLLLAAVSWSRTGAEELARRFFVQKHENAHTTSYDPIVEYLHRVEPSGTSIATSEPGSLGYRLGAKYQVIDQLGLTSPGVARALRDGDYDYPFSRWEPRYLVVSWNGKFSPLRSDWFDAAYEEVAEFHHPYWTRHLDRGVLLYRRVDSARVCRKSRFHLVGRTDGRVGLRARHGASSGTSETSLGSPHTDQSKCEFPLGPGNVRKKKVTR